MQTFRIESLPAAEARVDRLAEGMARFELHPSYQRQSDVWGEEKRQLFIDSLINGYDVPKLYFHRLTGKGKHAPGFAIVDGKQRLEAIRLFLDSKVPLSPDFIDVTADESPDAAAGKTFEKLTSEHPALASRLLRRSLDIVVIETEDLEIIEELFSRLNEAVPLNAPEKRNAFGGPMPPIIRRLVKDHIFFSDRLPIENTRYRQFDLVTKFLYLTEADAFVPTKKRALDVRGYREASERNANEAKTRADGLAERVTSLLNAMAGVFEDQDDLLTSVGLVTVYFMAFLIASRDAGLKKRLKRERLLEFDRVRRHNRQLLRRQQAAVARGELIDKRVTIRQDLAIFDRLMQSPNDGQALEYRFRILRAFVEDHRFTESLPDDLSRRVGGP